MDCRGWATSLYLKQEIQHRKSFIARQTESVYISWLRGLEYGIVREDRGEKVLNRKRTEQKRRRPGAHSAGRRLLRTGATVFAIGFAAVLRPEAVAAGTLEQQAAAQSAVGTLPLLAALGIGIVVAVGAVIAFLHLTVKGREAGGYAGWTDEEALADVPADVPQTLDAGPPDDVADPTTVLGNTRIMAALSDEELESGPRLYGAEGEFRGLTFRVGDSGLLIGRDPSCCDVVFPVEAGEVSRRHCTLHFESEQQLFYLEDLGSSNGTYLADGSRLRPGQRYPLQAGDKFSLSGKVHWFAVRN